MSRRASMRLIGVVFAALAALWTLPIEPAAANNHVIELEPGDELTTVSVTLGQSLVLQSSEPFFEVSVANPTIADVAPLSQSAVYLLGQSIGRTNMTVLGENGRVMSVVDVKVVPDLAELRLRLNDLLPGEDITVRPLGEGLVVSGTLSGAAKVGRAMELAEQYAPGKVSNMTQVRGAQQVMLNVRFAEMQRSTAKQLGLNFGLSDVTGDFQYSVLTGDGLNIGSIASAGLSAVTGDLLIDVLLDALEEKGQLRTLAEPTLVALSGDVASFLAGGEVPIPFDIDTDGGDDDVSLIFKQFGISLSFTPTVIDGDLINLELETEVSAIDPNAGISTGGLAIPGFAVRRAETTVELREGQSFAIAGLLQEDFRDTVRQLPWLGDVPVLGTMFRNTDFERTEKELVIIVTPRLAIPADSPNAFQKPTDNVGVPSESELFLLGATEALPEGVFSTFGFDSNYGYVVE